jgi:hypothetical protein
LGFYPFQKWRIKYPLAWNNNVENLAGFFSRKWSSNGGHRRVTQQATKSVKAKSQYKERSRWTKDILMSCHQEFKHTRMWIWGAIKQMEVWTTTTETFDQSIDKYGPQVCN